MRKTRVKCNTYINPPPINAKFEKKNTCLIHENKRYMFNNTDHRIKIQQKFNYTKMVFKVVILNIILNC